MGRTQNSFILLCIILLGLFLFPGARARLLNGDGGRKPDIGNGYEGFEDVKRSGPSPGVGHFYKTLEVVKEPSPSPGQGHKCASSSIVSPLMRLLSKTFPSIKPPISKKSRTSDPNPPSPSSLSVSIPNSENSTSISKSWCVYLILSTNPPIKTYVGSTNDFPRRLKQHNGELGGGAKASRAGRPWICACIVQGFDCQSEACKFESKWKSLSRKLPRNVKSDNCTVNALLQHRRKALIRVKELFDCSNIVIDWKINP